MSSLEVMQIEKIHVKKSYMFKLKMIWQGFKFPNTGLPSLSQSFSSIHFNPLSHRQLLTVVRLLQPKTTTITEQYALKL